MNSCVRLIENIRGFMDNSANSNEEQMKDLAYNYSGACTQLNEELKQCAVELHSGHVSEAIRICDKLNVLSCYECLSFEERETWCLSVEMILGISTPDLLSRIAEELFFCREDHQSMEILLRRHRLLAWQKESLKVRLPILRKLYKLEPNNEQWLNDLKSWETARCEEIARNEIKSITNEPQLTALCEELAPNAMHIPIPEILNAEIKRLNDQFCKEHVSKLILQLKDKILCIIDQLKNAINRNDLENAQQQWSEWTSCTQKLANLGEEPDFYQSMQVEALHTQLFNALEKQRIEEENKRKKEAFDKIIRDAAQLFISDSSNIEDVITMYNNVKQASKMLEFRIPAEITRMYKSRYQKHLDSVTFYNRMFLGVALAVVLCCIALVVALVMMFR